MLPGVTLPTPYRRRNLITPANNTIPALKAMVPHGLVLPLGGAAVAGVGGSPVVGVNGGGIVGRDWVGVAAACVQVGWVVVVTGAGVGVAGRPVGDGVAGISVGVAGTAVVGVLVGLAVAVAWAAVGVAVGPDGVALAGNGGSSSACPT